MHKCHSRVHTIYIIIYATCQFQKARAFAVILLYIQVYYRQYVLMRAINCEIINHHHHRVSGQTNIYSGSGQVKIKKILYASMNANKRVCMVSFLFFSVFILHHFSTSSANGDAVLARTAHILTNDQSICFKVIVTCEHHQSRAAREAPARQPYNHLLYAPPRRVVPSVRSSIFFCILFFVFNVCPGIFMVK